MIYNIPSYSIPRTSASRYHYVLAEFAGILLPPLTEYIEPEVNAEATEHVLESENITLVENYTLSNIVNSEHSLESSSIEWLNFDLITHNSEHALESDNLSITQEQTLVIYNSEHVLRSQIITWVSNTSLIINSSDHNLESENIVLIQDYKFPIHNTKHNLESSGIEWINFELISHNSEHVLESKTISLVYNLPLIVNNSEHNLESINVYLPSSTINLYLWGVSTSHISSIQMIPTGEIQKIL